MDINMPVMDGIQATGLIHSEFPKISVVGYSIYNEESQSAPMLKAGAAAFLSKSGPSDDLLETIRSLVHK
jgi:DNA-binding NarL/FixJ family response regulator